MDSSTPIDWKEEPNLTVFKFDPVRYVDALVTPWYSDHKKMKAYDVEGMTGED